MEKIYIFTIENFVFRISQSLLYEYDFLALADRNRGLRDMQNTLIFTKIGKYVMKQDDKSILKLKEKNKLKKWLIPLHTLMHICLSIMLLI